MKIIFKATIVIILILVAISVTADVGVYVQHRNGDKNIYCIGASENDDGYETLSKIKSADFQVIENRHILCNINDEDVNFICDSSSDRTWREFLQDNGEWHDEDIASLDAGDDCYDTDFNALLNFIHYSFVTHTFSNIHYCAKDQDVIGILNDERPTSQPKAPDFELTPSFDEICSPIKITSLKVYANGKKKSGIDEDGGNIRDVLPGTELEIRIEIENIIPEEIEKEIRDVIVTATIENIDGDDMEEESDKYDLDPGDDKTIKFKFRIPEMADEDDYDFILEIEAEDKDGFNYYEKLDMEIEIEKERHDVVVSEFELSDNDICVEAKAGINVKISNKGSSDEDLSLNIINKELSLEINEEFTLEDTSKNNANVFEKIYSFKVSKNIKVGKYPISMLINYGKSTIGKEATLNVIDCETNEIIDSVPEDIIDNDKTSSKPTGFFYLIPEKALKNSIPLIISIVLASLILIVVLVKRGF